MNLGEALMNYHLGLCGGVWLVFFEWRWKAITQSGSKWCKPTLT